MKLLAEIRESDLEGISPSPHVEQYRVRRAVRAIIFDEEGNTVLSHVAKGDYWKIPGGGIEEGESIEEALEREAMEEAGVEIEIGDPIGVIIEYRDAWEQLQISYCYHARVVGEKKVPEYDEGEREKRFSSHWMPYQEALKYCNVNVSDKIYEAKFMQTRDGIFMRNIQL